LHAAGGLMVSAPKGGAGALIYYQECSEPEVAAAIRLFVEPGMTVWDVGAHIGEFTLFAAGRAGPTGRVEAFEPQPGVLRFLRNNVTRNGFTNVGIHDIAICDGHGRTVLALTKEPSKSFLYTGHAILSQFPTSAVNSTSLDCFYLRTRRRPNVIKVDVEGAEMLVLRGASMLLNLPAGQAPVWIMEFEPANCAAFGYDAAELIAHFRDHGFYVYWLKPDGCLKAIMEATPPHRVRTLIATKGMQS
jgi:FkbM family methyltransferase